MWRGERRWKQAAVSWPPAELPGEGRPSVVEDSRSPLQRDSIPNSCNAAKIASCSVHLLAPRGLAAQGRS